MLCDASRSRTQEIFSKLIGYKDVLLKDALWIPKFWRYGVGLCALSLIYVGIYGIRQNLGQKPLFLNSYIPAPIACTVATLGTPFFPNYSAPSSPMLLPFPSSSSSSKIGTDRRGSEQTFSLPLNKSLESALVHLGISSAEVKTAVALLLQKRAWTKIRGITVSGVYQQTAQGKILLHLSMPSNLTHQLKVSRTAKGTFSREKIRCPLEAHFNRIQGTVQTSLVKDLQNRKIPQSVIQAIVSALEVSGINWRLDIRRGDQFSFLCKELRNPSTGAKAFEGVIFTKFFSKSKGSRVAYQYKPKGALRPMFYNEQGCIYGRVGKRGARNRVAACSFIRPVAGKVTSPYGWRRHPVLGTRKFHSGVDLSAPYRTPVMAAASGVVDKVQRFGGYGLYVRIRHGGGYHSAYAHLSSYARALRVGQRVQQGQCIGYVGSTGLASGPHLHFEVLRYKSYVNPLSVKSLPSSETLSAVASAPASESQTLVGTQRAQFLAYIKNLQKIYRDSEITTFY